MAITKLESQFILREFTLIFNYNIYIIIKYLYI